MSTDHGIHCDCDACLNRGGGMRLAELPPRDTSLTGSRVERRAQVARRRRKLLTKQEQNERAYQKRKLQGTAAE